jgi:hypothetical protein
MQITWNLDPTPYNLISWGIVFALVYYMTGEAGSALGRSLGRRVKRTLAGPRLYAKYKKDDSIVRIEGPLTGDTLLYIITKYHSQGWTLIDWETLA